MQINKEMVQRISNLRTCGILANGRSGSDFLQSLFDGHPEVLTFNGFFLFYDFWQKSLCNKVERVDLVDFADEFVGHFIEKLKSRYDLQERKDQMGPNRDQSLDLELEQFKKYVIDYLNLTEFNSRNALLATSLAYHLCLGRDWRTLKVFLHHPHVEDECEFFLKDFPEAQLILMTRDPRANLQSSITNYSKYYPRSAGNFLILDYLKSIFLDTDRYTPKTANVVAIKIETLDRLEIHKKICADLGIQYDTCMTHSTWGGLLWYGDRLSQTKSKDPNSRDILRNGWESKISWRDLILINYFTRQMRFHYGYTSKETAPILWILVPLLILMPLSFEIPYLIPTQIRKAGFSRYAMNWFYYFKRIHFLMGLYIRNARFTSGKYY